MNTTTLVQVTVFGGGDLTVFVNVCVSLSFEKDHWEALTFNRKNRVIEWTWRKYEVAKLLTILTGKKTRGNRLIWFVGRFERTHEIITYTGVQNLGNIAIVVCLRVPVLFACRWDGGNSRRTGESWFLPILEQCTFQCKPYTSLLRMACLVKLSLSTPWRCIGELDV